MVEWQTLKNWERQQNWLTKLMLQQKINTVKTINNVWDRRKNNHRLNISMIFKNNVT